MVGRVWYRDLRVLILNYCFILLLELKLARDSKDSPTIQRFKRTLDVLGEMLHYRNIGLYRNCEN